MENTRGGNGLKYIYIVYKRSLQHFKKPSDRYKRTHNNIQVCKNEYNVRMCRPPSEGNMCQCRRRSSISLASVEEERRTQALSSLDATRSHDVWNKTRALKFSVELQDISRSLSHLKRGIAYDVYSRALCTCYSYS